MTFRTLGRPVGFLAPGRRLAPFALAALAACSSDATAPITAPVGSPLDSRQRTGAPSAPLALTAAAGNAAATVSWQPPSNTGTSALVSYTVTTQPGGTKVTIAAPTTSATVTGLTNGTAYTFTVVARSGAGAGPASQPSSAVTPTVPIASHGRWVTGYYVGYQRALYPETAVDFTYMTHVVLGAVQATSTGGVTTDFYLDNTNGPIMARTLSTRAHAAGRKAILMLGGAGYHDALVNATSATYRATFVANLLRTLDSLRYDGLDVDWEPLNESDKPQLLQFFHDLRAARPALLITTPIGWVNANLGADSWYAQVAPLVDQMNVMSYEMADNWGGWVSWHTAALYGDGPDHPSSVSSTINAYRAVGVPAAKLGVGIGTYGSCWRGTTAPLQTLAASAGVVASDNAMSYANIVGQYYSAAAYHWDATARIGYLSFAAPTGPQQCAFVSYEDPRSAGEKGAYVAAQGLGGTIVWTLGEGHLPSAASGQQDPLLRAAYTAVAP
ncbi:MAG TPA: glycosyl hydrolase family 18 protein [Gemmatirosa sp.]